MSDMYPPPPPNQPPNQPPYGPPPDDSGYQYGYPPPPPPQQPPDGYGYPQQPVWGAGGPSAPPPPPPRRGGMSPTVITVVIVAILGAVVAGLAIFASMNKDDDKANIADPMTSTPAIQTTTATPDPIPTTTSDLPDPTFDPGTGNTKDIATTYVGDCLNDPGDEFTGDVEVVSCTESHAREVFAAGKLDPGTYDKDYVVSRAEKYCKEKFKPYVGKSFDSSKLDVNYIYPLEGNWNLGDRSITCLVSDPDNPSTTGSFKNSNV